MALALSRLLNRNNAASLRVKAQKEEERGHWARATLLWLKLAEGGDPEACHVLGERYECGRGAVQNFIESERWFRTAAEAGNPASQAKLGEIYFHGRTSGQGRIQANPMLKELLQPAG